MQASQEQYNPDDYIETASLGTEIAPHLLRKLRSITAQIDLATEIEDFQSIGVQSREILIELGNYIYDSHMAGNQEQPQASNFKKKAELTIQFYLNESDNADYRSMIKKLTEATWDYANKIAQLHAGADERRKTPPVGAIRQLDIVRPTGCEHRIFADDRAGLIGDLAAAHGGFKERIGKAERQVVRRDVKGVVQHQKRAAQKFTRADGELSEIVLRKELFKQRFGAAHFPYCFAHAVYSSNLVLSAQQIFSLLYRQLLVFARGKDKLYSRTRKEGRKKKEDASVHGIPCAE